MINSMSEHNLSHYLTSDRKFLAKAKKALDKDCLPLNVLPTTNSLRKSDCRLPIPSIHNDRCFYLIAVAENSSRRFYENGIESCMLSFSHSFIVVAI